MICRLLWQGVSRRKIVISHKLKYIVNGQANVFGLNLGLGTVWSFDLRLLNTTEAIFLWYFCV